MVVEKNNFRPYQLKVAQNTQTDIPTIVHVNGNFIIGGTSQLMVDIIERTSDKYKHKVVVPDLPTPVPYQPVDLYTFSIFNMKELYTFLKKEQPDLVHIQFWVRDSDRYMEFAFWYRAIFEICSELQLKVIQNVNVPTTPFNSKCVLHNVFVSNYVRANFNRVSDTPSSVIYPGSDFSHFYNQDINISQTIGMVYRLSTDKLNYNSIEVFITVVKHKFDVKCIIVGDGILLKHFQQRVAEEGLEKSFTFTGNVSYESLPSLYESMSIFVAPVHDESFGQVTPFAMSMGLSIAGYNIGALSEILGTDETLAEPENIHQLSDRIISILENKEKRIKQGNFNRDRAHQMFSVETMVDRYAALYKQYIL